jgi:hypothetical protein
MGEAEVNMKNEQSALETLYCILKSETHHRDQTSHADEFR